jgi:polyisoprenoid-binding protein YceI
MTVAKLLTVALAMVALPFFTRSADAIDWKVVAAKSWLGFTGTASGARFEGRFSRWQVRIAFDPAQAELGRAVVTVDMTSAVTGDRQADQALPQADWFDAAAFPESTLEVQSLRRKGGNDYEAVGTLTLRNITKAIVMPMTIEVSGNTLHAKGRLDLLRTDYGVGRTTGAQWVGLEVVAAFNLTAERVP